MLPAEVASPRVKQSIGKVCEIMNTEIRNELIMLSEIFKANNQDKGDIKMVLDRFDTDIRTRLRKLQVEKEKLENDYKILQEVKKELNVE